MLKYLIVVYLVCSGHALLSQSQHTLIGARAQGLGYSSACLYDALAIFNNVAGLARQDHLSASFAYENHPQLAVFNRMAFVVAAPVPKGAAAFGAYKFGDDLYSEQLITAGYANSFGLASLGLRVNYIQYHTSEFGNKGVFSISLGGIAHLTDKLAVGAHISNVSQAKLSKESKEYLPTIMTAGFSLTPSSKVLLTTEIEKDLDYDATWKTGVEYKPAKKFSFRSGFNIHPDAGFAGVGFRSTHFSFDYAFQFTFEAGSNHQATIVYHFSEKKS